MKFFTRELYAAMQDESQSDEFEKKWEATCSEYRRHFDRVRSLLPDRARTLAGITFHDGVIREVSQPSERTLHLKVDASRNPWGPRGVFQIRFDGIRSVSNLAGLVGNTWLYEEIDIAPDEAFEFRVLFDHSELVVVATAATIEPPPSPP